MIKFESNKYSYVPPFIIMNEVQWYPPNLPSSSELAELLHD